MRTLVTTWTSRITETRRAVADGIQRIYRHERWALYGHSQEVLERIVVARQARNLPELIHDQIDLIPESRRRIARNAEMRRRILQKLRHSINAALRESA
jgi:hypothetical protein